MKNTIKKLAEQLSEEVIKIRRHLHQYPELSQEEHETSVFIQEKLTEYNIPFQSGIAGTGVLGIIEGDKPGKTVALRADMDALPIEEETGLAFSSTREGVMHACGHDAHMAMLLGAGKVLMDVKEELEGTVLLVFQPSEEKAPVGGARPMLEDGVFDKYKPDVIYGQHVWPSLPVGEFGVLDEEMMGASDTFVMTIKGTGGHASMPQSSTDPIVTAAQLIVNLQTIVSRALDPLEASVVTVSKIQGGHARNIIPNEVQIEGSIRTYKREIKERLKERLFEIASHVGKMYNNEIIVEYFDGYPATINTPTWARLAREAIIDLYGEKAVPDVKPSLAAEDFSRFLEEIPGAFIWLGARMDEEQSGLHESTFTIDEQALTKGVSFFAYVAYNTLRKLQTGVK